MRLSMERWQGMIWLIQSGNKYIGTRACQCDIEPSPTVTTNGIGASNHSNYWIECDDQPMTTSKQEKPFYKVPSMEEIRAIPWNGFKVASTFSGCGGSCTGYRMAGFKVVWANEFVPIAQQSYKANAAADCYLDPRDIKTINPEEILEKTGLAKGELDLFDGSPPCQAFSTAGKREKGWGKEKQYEHGAKQCNEQLFWDYIRLLNGLKPKTFVAENVSGLVKGTAKGMFLEILKELKSCGYKVACKVLDAQWLGVPQTRQRTIFVGVRNDIGLDPVFPKPLPYRYSVAEACPEIIKAFSGVGQLQVEMIAGNEAFKPIWKPLSSGPSPTIMASGSHGGSGELRIQSGARPKHYQSADKPSPAGNDGRTAEIKNETIRRKFTIQELKRICAFPDDFIICGTYSQQWKRLGNSVPPVMMYHIAKQIRDEILSKIPTP